jgi:hypothetical protein
LIFIKKGGEIRLCETLATNPEFSGERCQNLIPGKREMIKINTEKWKHFFFFKKTKFCCHCLWACEGRGFNKK